MTLERALAWRQRVWKSSAMGMYDTVVVLDDLHELRCANGHALHSFQTKDLDDSSMTTYLVRSSRLYRAEATDAWSHVESERTSWRIDGDAAVFERRYTLSEVRGPLVINVHCGCDACGPVLVRTPEAGLYGDIVTEHGVFVDFRLAFGPGASLHIERTSGTREDLKRELGSRGVFVLHDDEPLAVAHREIGKARLRASEHVPWSRRRF